MKLLRLRLPFAALCLLVGALAFGVSYSMLGQGPGSEDDSQGTGNTGESTGPGGGDTGGGNTGGGDDDATPPTETPEELQPEQETPGPVGQVDELLDVIHDWDSIGVAALKELLDDGADPNVSGENGLTGLHIAVVNSDINPVAYQQVEVLLEGGADPNTLDDFGKSPLHHAASWGGSGALAQALLRAGANPDMPDADGLTPLAHALRDGNEGAIRALETATAARPSNYQELADTGKINQSLWKKLDATKTPADRRAVVDEWISELIESGTINESDAQNIISVVEDAGLFEEKGGR